MASRLMMGVSFGFGRLERWWAPLQRFNIVLKLK